MSINIPPISKGAPMDNQTRLEQFEDLLASLEQEFAETEARLSELTAAGKQKSATFKQLFARKLSLKQFLDMFEERGLR